MSVGLFFFVFNLEDSFFFLAAAPGTGSDHLGFVGVLGMLLRAGIPHWMEVGGAVGGDGGRGREREGFLQAISVPATDEFSWLQESLDGELLSWLEESLEGELPYWLKVVEGIAGGSKVGDTLHKEV